MLNVFLKGLRIAYAAFLWLWTMEGSRFRDWLGSGEKKGPQRDCPRCGPMTIRITEQEAAEMCRSCPLFRALLKARRGVRVLRERQRRRRLPSPSRHVDK